MMPLENLTVYIEYRYQAGAASPSWKALRARVRAADADGFIFGNDLISPTLTDFSAVRNACIAKLQGKCRRVTFVYAPDLCKKEEVFQL